MEPRNLSRQRILQSIKCWWILRIASDQKQLINDKQESHPHLFISLSLYSNPIFFSFEAYLRNMLFILTTNHLK